MGIAASTKKGVPATSAVIAGGTKDSNEHDSEEKRAEEEQTQEDLKAKRKAELQRKLRSKVRAIATFRNCIKSASVWDTEENEVFKDSQNGTGGAGRGEENGNKEEDRKALGILYHPRSNREELKQFLWKLKEADAECWEHIQSDDRDLDAKYSIHQKEVDESKIVCKDLQSKRKGITRRFTMPPELDPVEDSVVCDMCNKIAHFNAACRICTRVFHRNCLEKSGRYNEVDITYINRAGNREGWSCYHCDDLAMLLSPADTADMMADFDKYDINRDEGLSLPEFIRFKRGQFNFLDGKELPDDEEELLVAQFQRMDTDSSGELDWWEFVRFESRRYLARKSEEEIVSLLTQKEKIHARKVYLGFTTEKEDNYTYLQGVFLSEGVRTWQDFLKDQALYIIWSRPNRENIAVT